MASLALWLSEPVLVFPLLLAGQFPLPTSLGSLASFIPLGRPVFYFLFSLVSSQLQLLQEQGQELGLASRRLSFAAFYFSYEFHNHSRIRWKDHRESPIYLSAFSPLLIISIWFL